jgi:glycosyltransferase involved in cell wall biosynthesis
MKGLDLLLEAVKIHKDMPGEVSKDASAGCKIRLVICGPDEEGTLERLKRQVEELGLTAAVEFREPVRGDAKWELVKSCDCLVLPSRSENFGLVVAEALACGKPVICTQGAPWEALEREDMGWWTPISAEGLAAAIGRFVACSDYELGEMGRQGRLYAAKNLSWDTAAVSILREIQSRR